MKRFFCAVLCVLLVIPALTGCTDPNEVERVNLYDQVSFEIPAMWLAGDTGDYSQEREFSCELTAGSRFSAAYYEPSRHADTTEYMDALDDQSYDIVNLEKRLTQFDDFSAYHITYTVRENDRKIDMYVFDAKPKGCVTLSISFDSTSDDTALMSDEEREEQLLKMMNSVQLLGQEDEDTGSVSQAESGTSQGSGALGGVGSDPMADYYQELGELIHPDAVYEEAGEGALRFIIPCPSMELDAFYEQYSEVLVSMVALQGVDVAGTGIQTIYLQFQDPSEDTILEYRMDFSSDPVETSTTQINPAYQDLLEQVLEKRKSE